jgi:hypothetical protein
MAETEAGELQEKIWTYTQRLAVLFIAFLAGLLVGLLKPLAVAPLFRPIGIQGPAGQLQEDVTQLEDRVAVLVKERDTLKSQMAIMDRDKKEVERRLQDLQARTGTQAEPGPGGVVVE